MMASPTLATPTTSKPAALVKTRPTATPSPSPSPPPPHQHLPLRRQLLASAITGGALSLSWLMPLTPAAFAADDDEYVKETEQVISKVRSTITMDRNDPNVADAVADLRETSNSWVAKYRKEKALLGKPSFRDIYSALNAVSGHYISFGPTAPIPTKRRARILEEMDTAEKALQRGR